MDQRAHERIADDAAQQHHHRQDGMVAEDAGDDGVY